MKLHRPLLLLPLFLLATVPQAQTKNTRLGFVNVQKVVAAVPGGGPYLDLRRKVDTDLAKRQVNIQQLTVKANRTRAKADADALKKAEQSFVTAQKNYQTRLAESFKPIGKRVDTTIAAVAKSNGFGVLFDYEVAASSKLVVYANTAKTDLTPAVLKALKK